MFAIITRSIFLKHLSLIKRLQIDNWMASVSTQTSNKEFKKTDQSINFKKGQILHGFIIDQVTPINEIYLTAVRLTHISTGAQYLHLSCDDSNNVFSIGFRTTPKDSTGLPHILEHITLCGSQRFPCRDPFFKMLRRSLATYMNAMTAPDYTIYPFSTQNFKDFQNLQSIYLDSVFKPKLREIDFWQEGWRLEHSDLSDEKSPIVFKGVVYNEMKGVFNDNQNIFAYRLINSILPSHTYSVISGGDPLEIPLLEHQDLIDFHALHYHPSNAYFYSYGNFPIEKHLKFINDEYLCLYDKIDTSLTKIPPEPRWKTPRRKHIWCKPEPLIADPNRQNSIAIASLCSDIKNIQETFNIYILSQLLLEGPISAFYESLVETNIGTDFSPMTGYESHCKDTIFIVSLQGVKEKDFETVENIYRETVIKVVKEGFSQEHINAVLHGIELQVKHQTSNFGLKMLLNIMPLWNHDGDIIQSMKINEAVSNFKESIKVNPYYLNVLAEKYLLQNKHQLTLTMSADQNYESRITAAENDLLKSKLEKLSPQELHEIYEKGHILLTEQQKEENIDFLPSLKINDLKKDVDRYELIDINIADIPVQIAIQPTNGICYYRGILSTHELSDDLRNLLPIFNDVVVKMGTENYDYKNWDRIVQLKTGGLYFSNHIVENKNDCCEYDEGIIINSYCLDHNAQSMWKLWEELFKRVKLTDLQRFENLVKMNASSLTNNISQSGHIYAMSSAASLISPVAKVKENLLGLEFVYRIKSIAQMENMSEILEQVKQISDIILKNPCLRSAINLTKESKDFVLQNIETFYEAVGGSVRSKDIMSFKKSPTNSNNYALHHVLPYTVNYVAQVILTVPYSHIDHAPLQVLSKLISSVYLHPEIREKGGAYGGGVELASDGCFMYYSYRDPNSIRTLDVFDNTWNFLSKYNLVESNIEEAKLTLFQSIDSPIAPSNRGIIKFTHGLTYDDIQQHRQRIKSVTKDHLMQIAKKYLSPYADNIKVSKSLIGPYNPELKSRDSDKWIIIDQKSQFQTIEVK